MLVASESPRPLRDQAILAFFIGTGCRLGEVVSLNAEDLQILADGSGIATVTGKRTKANKTGVHQVAFDATTGKYLIPYIDDYVIVSGPVWLNDAGDRLGKSGIYGMVNRTVAKAGLSDTIRGCHDLRRAFATILGMMHPESPAWADMIRRQLGHKSYAMTSHYTIVNVDDIREWLTSPLAPEK
jgi:integrase